MELSDRKESDRRTISDRRKRPTPFISKHIFFGGRRKTIRREADRGKHIFVDVYSPILFIAFLSVIALALVDACLTVILIQRGIAEEANPIMSFYLGYGIERFVMAKFLLTAVPAVVLCVCKDFPITKVSLVSALFFYFSIILYELNILFRFQ